MFKLKRNVTFITPLWDRILSDSKRYEIPRIAETILIGDSYYKVLNVIHEIDKKNSYFVVCEKINNFLEK